MVTEFGDLVESLDQEPHLLVWILPGANTDTRGVEAMAGRVADALGEQVDVRGMPSLTSKDSRSKQPNERWKEMGREIGERLKAGGKVLVVMTSLGAGEWVQVAKRMDPDVLQTHNDQLSLMAISPAGFYQDVQGMARFFAGALMVGAAQDGFRLGPFSKDHDTVVVEGVVAQQIRGLDSKQNLELLRVILPDFSQWEQEIETITPGEEGDFLGLMDELFLAELDKIDGEIVMTYEEYQLCDSVDAKKTLCEQLKRQVVARGIMLRPVMARIFAGADYQMAEEAKDVSTEAVKTTVAVGMLGLVDSYIRLLWVDRLAKWLEEVKEKGVRIQFGLVVPEYDLVTNVKDVREVLKNLGIEDVQVVLVEGTAHTSVGYRLGKVVRMALRKFGWDTGSGKAA